MTIRFRLPGGTLKFKRHHQLRQREMNHEVPVWKVGPIYVIWWPDNVPTGRRL